jgi:hypothetical protein
VASKKKSTLAIMLYVGKSHVKYMEYLLQLRPFNIEIVHMLGKCKNQEQFDTQLDLHDLICHHSQAVKLVNVSEMFPAVFSMCT